MNIVLIGFASSGKSTTARALCGLLRMRHVDLDRVIEDIYERETKTRATCREVFKALGANGFTDIEHRALKTLTGYDNTVLSTGGRAPINEDNRPLLKSFGKIVYLKCNVDNIILRMRRKGSPLTMGNKPEEISAEWQKRNPIYSSLADIVIDNDTLTPDITSLIIADRAGRGPARVEGNCLMASPL